MLIDTFICLWNKLQVKWTYYHTHHFSKVHPVISIDGNDLISADINSGIHI